MDQREAPSLQCCAVLLCRPYCPPLQWSVLTAIWRHIWEVIIPNHFNRKHHFVDKMKVTVGLMYYLYHLHRLCFSNHFL